MVLVTQPPKSSVCGQAVIAMILGISLDEAMGIVGHRRGTKAAGLRRVLRDVDGIELGCAELTRYEEIPSRAILRLSRPTGRNWHWMLWWDGEIYDPAGRLQERLAKGWTITSFMRIGDPQ